MVSQAEALARTVASLTLGSEYDALIAYCAGLAEVLDEHPERATLWREYRPALELLVRAGEVEADDGEATFLRLVSTSVGDTSKARKAVAGAGGRGGGGTTRPAADAVATPSRRRGPGTSA